MRTAEALNQVGDKSSAGLAIRILSWWSKVTTNVAPAGHGAVIAYVESFRDTMPGRGLPSVYDTELGQRALNRGNSLVPESVKGQDSIQALMEQMKEVLEGQKRTAARVDSLASAVSDLKSKVNTKKPGEGQQEEKPCGNCGKLGHYARNCPDKKDG